MQFFNFSGKRLDIALRDFLSHICLKGESSERAHLLMYFSKHYFECNPTLFNSIGNIINKKFISLNEFFYYFRRNSCFIMFFNFT